MFWRRRPASEEGSDDPDSQAATTVVTEPAVVSVGEPDAALASQPDAALTPEPDGAPAPVPGWPTYPAPSLEEGVRKSRQGFMSRLTGVLRAGSYDEETWEEVEETLISGDIGAALAVEVVARARSRNDAPEEAVKAELLALLADRPAHDWRPRRPSPTEPAVVLVVGVNGTGKTTTIAKLAARLGEDDSRVLLAAADTFRAAAIEQLQTWAGRLKLPVVAHAPGADPSAVVYDALDAGIARGMDVVIVDTAGRLHTKSNLMDELAKIRRTIDRRLTDAEPEVLFVLDATTGQNGLAQARAFHESSPLSGIVLTKLDSTARGGIVFAIERALAVPVVFIGVGERVEDLLPFDPRTFVEALFA